MSLSLDAEHLEALGYQQTDWFDLALYGERLRRRQQELKREYNRTPRGRVKHRAANAASRKRARERDPEKVKAQQREWWHAAQERKRQAAIAAGLPAPKTRRRRAAP